MSELQGAPRQAGWLQGLALVLPVCTIVMDSAFLAPNIPLMVEQFSDMPGVKFWVPAMVTVPSLVLALFCPVAGIIVDTLQRRRMLIIGLIVYGLLATAPFFLRDFWAIFATRVVIGLMEAFVLTASSLLISDYFSGARRDHWLAMQTTVASVSVVVMFPLGGIVGEFGWRYVFGLYAMVLLLAPLAILATWEPERSREVARRATPWALLGLVILLGAAFCYAVGQVAGIAGPLVLYVAVLVLMALIGFAVPKFRSKPSTDPMDDSWSGFPWLRLSGIYAITASASLMFYLVQINLADVFVEAGLSSSGVAGVLIAVSGLGMTLATFAFSRFSRAPVSVLLLIGFGMMGIGFFGMSHAPGIALMVVSATVNQFGCGLVLPTLLTWTVRQVPPGQRGRGVGFWQGFFNGGQFVGVSFIAVVAATFTDGKVTPAFSYISVLAAVVAIGAVIALLVGKGAKPLEYAPQAASSGDHAA